MVCIYLYPYIPLHATLRSLWLLINALKIVPLRLCFPMMILTHHHFLFIVLIFAICSRCYYYDPCWNPKCVAADGAPFMSTFVLVDELRFLCLLSACIFFALLSGVAVTSTVKLARFRRTKTLITPFIPMKPYGGASVKAVAGQELLSYCLNSDLMRPDRLYVYVRSDSRAQCNGNEVCCQLPLSVLVRLAPLSKLQIVFRHHGVPNVPYLPLESFIARRLETHNCTECDQNFHFFRLKDVREQSAHGNGTWRLPTFFPSPLSQIQKETIIRNACAEFEARLVEETGCAICGRLVRTTQMASLRTVKDNISLLAVPGIARHPRESDLDEIRYVDAPVLANDSNLGCPKCIKSLQAGSLPNEALASGMWLGNVPPELSTLRFAEKLLISRIRRNVCVGRIASGGHKLISKAVMFTNPLPKIYVALPPPLADMDEVLSVIYTGPVKPTAEELKRTPFLVRRNAVGAALKWLKRNHSDYRDLEISVKNLNEYPECDIPVTLLYRELYANKDAESTSVHDTEAEAGTSVGPCPFAVHGLMGNQLQNMDLNALKQSALRHLENGGKVLAIGHGDQMVSIFQNPRLYPMMFPWLFPYGSGGIGTTPLGYEAHLQHLLMYQDKRFQTDDHFVLVAFHHLQVRNASMASFLVAERSSFSVIAKRLLSIDLGVLKELIDRLENGPVSTSSLNDEQKQCFQLLKDIDVVGSHIDGFVTSKKIMRAEIWSLLVYLGAPSWYITISPADINHPLCVYWASTGDEYRPNLTQYRDAVVKVIRNPVAAARFFDFMVRLFIKHALGVGSSSRGLFGDTAAYYGTVEQQGRLTLHLHLLLWIANSLSPADVRLKLDDESSPFWSELVAYLEDCHQGEFMTGTKEEVEHRWKEQKDLPDYVPATQSLPTSPPRACKSQCGVCRACRNLIDWQDKFRLETDELLLKSNVHRCTNNRDEQGNIKTNRTHGGCLSKWGVCKARFPRLLILKTMFDLITKHISVKKREAMLNTFHYVLTYILRCNTDVTSLLSGTAIKAVIAYVTDYITKSSLKTHVMFEIILTVLDANSDLLSGDGNREEKARKLLNKIVNTMGVKLEIGGPFASLYLLGLPDHYTSHRFVPFFWRVFVSETMRPFLTENPDRDQDTVVIKKVRGAYIGTSRVDDYKYRPLAMQNLCLWDWVRLARVRRIVSMKEEMEKEANHPIPNATDEDNGNSDLEESDAGSTDDWPTNSEKKADTMDLDADDIPNKA